MVIDFEQLKEEVRPEFKGGKGAYIVRSFEENSSKLMLGKLEPGSSIGVHTHENDAEAIYILSGKADIIYDDGTEHAVPGQCHFCPKGHSHSMINNGDEPLVYFAAVL